MGRTGRRMVEVLRRARVALRRLRLDGLRLSRRAHALRLAFDKLAVRHRGYVWLSQGQLFLLQGVVGPGTCPASIPALNLGQARSQPISVWVHSNLDEVELFLNGQSQGSQKVQPLTHLEWKVKYMPGVIEARGKKDGKVVLTEKRETTGDPKSIKLTADRSEIDANGEDIAVLRIEVLDDAGRPIPTASNMISFKVTGDGALIGVGNGDPNCQESDKEPKRSLFNGL